MTRPLHLFAFAALLLPAGTAHAAAFELKDGDRVVFLGNSFFERARDYGHIENELVCRWPRREIAFRNLGWDGDTVFGHSRAGGRRRAVFGEPEEGFQRMVGHVRSLRPTVIFVAYGYNESFEHGPRLKPFREGLERLLKELATEDTSIRFVLLSPTPMETGFGTELEFTNQRGRSYVAGRNALLERYARTVGEVAKIGGHHSIDLFTPLLAADKPYTENGIHPSSKGYQRIAEIIAESLKCPPPAFAVYPEDVRQAIIRKNTLYFHRWRPRNDAFVYGERKNEQKIAQTEPEKFEPFVAGAETEIREILDWRTGKTKKPKDAE